ncbi:16S rRNA (guanine(527)-N(7))-methyltransferase RsmG [Maritalea porphyrae]|uniref:16S rRNA (guanine(527)-N(7))-methyltransferase RsmG n=1 Tax=Maritalea porphyrae TaxID=880732 RepID=UPI0022AEA346|nr:16S rRNA (guanine(527)-N(7))-methyltransferase RsmG [Maritalea porphyrae]MCZ4272261.1 16S rRNA (guanine(527)-N(7))-methyltransferase RsmG [Maritalea porphyrae]
MISPTTSDLALLLELCAELELDYKPVLTDLQKYAQELVRWQDIKNLVSRETLPEIWPRHILDSLQLAKHVDPKRGILLDYGSGGGLPAIPLAIVFKNTPLQVHMIEANGRKCSFLRQISRQLVLNCVVHNQRVEALVLDPAIEVGTMTARGFADLGGTFSYCFPHFGPHTHALLQKGRGYDEEIAAAQEKWRYDLETFSSVVAPDSVILAISGLKQR